jgi:hypothetical protein
MLADKGNGISWNKALTANQSAILVAASKPAVTIFHPDGRECPNAAVLQNKTRPAKATSKEIDPRLFFHGFYWFEKGLYFLEI